MADLRSLIRVRKHAVEDKQKALSELYRQAEELTSEKQALQDDLKRERQKVDEMGVEALGYFGRYSQVVKERSELIDHKMVMLENRIEIAREDMRIAFAELKKVEITQKRRDDEEEAEIKKAEDQSMDEIGLESYRRDKDTS